MPVSSTTVLRRSTAPQGSPPANPAAARQHIVRALRGRMEGQCHQLRNVLFLAGGTCDNPPSGFALKTSAFLSLVYGMIGVVNYPNQLPLHVPETNTEDFNTLLGSIPSAMQIVEPGAASVVLNAVAAYWEGKERVYLPAVHRLREQATMYAAHPMQTSTGELGRFIYETLESIPPAVAAK